MLQDGEHLEHVRMMERQVLVIVNNVLLGKSWQIACSLLIFTGLLGILHLEVVVVGGDLLGIIRQQVGLCLKLDSDAPADISE